MRATLKIGIILLAIIIAIVSTVSGQIPLLVNYQGRLTETGGAPVPNGLYLINFKIYGSELGDDSLWWSGFQNVEVLDGLFEYRLGSMSPLPPDLFGPGSERFLGVTIGADPEGVPRIHFTSVAFSFHAQSSGEAGHAGHATFSDTASYAHEGPTGGLSLPYSNVAVDVPGPAFHVGNEGGTGIHGLSGDNDGIVGWTGASAKSGLYGYSNLGIGVSGRAEGNNHGVLGVTNSSGLHSGVRGVSNGDGYGVSAWAEGTALFAKSPYGYAANLDGKVNIEGITVMAMDSGMAAWISSDEMGDNDSGVVYINFSGEQNFVNQAATTALYCVSYTDDSSGIGAMIYGGEHGIICGSHGGSHSRPSVGQHSSASGGTFNTGVDTWVASRLDGSLQGSQNVGVWSSASDGVATIGVIAKADKDLFTPYYPKWCYGVLASGTKADSACYGLHATGYNADTTYGVYAYAYDGATAAYGIYAKAPTGPTDWAGYFEGDVNVTGGMWAGAKYFKIDHPLDPENKYLTHACVESPERLSVYSGTIGLDSRGEATIVLPEYFEALNDDLRYQLTPIGAAMPDLHVATEVDGNSFRVAGGVAGMRVSWEVSGVRIDAYAKSNPIQVEREKPATERGRYMHPTAFGLDASFGIHGEGKHPAPKRDEQMMEKTRRAAYHQ